MTKIDLKGRVIAITGASSGIGLAAARACARAGMSVALGARRLDRLESLAAELRASGVQAAAIRCDVSDPDACTAFIEQAETALGRVYAVFANAGYGVEAPALEMRDDEWEAMFRTNFWGTLWTVRAAVERMRAGSTTTDQPRGHVIICTSCVSKVGAPFHAAYSASKACQDHLARALRHELAGELIHVSSVHPVGTRTEFFDLLEKQSPHSLGISSSNTALQHPDAVARAIVRCLHRPIGEVWTSVPTRLALAFVTAFPGLGDKGIARYMRSRMRR